MAELNDHIEKYKKGELTTAEMNALEKRALSDPFLADALEGADMIPYEDFSSDVAELNLEILGHKKKRSWTPLRIAAGIALLATVSSVIYVVSSQQDSAQQLSKNEIPAASPNDSSVRQIDSLKTKTENLLTLNEPKPIIEEKKTNAFRKEIKPKYSPSPKQEADNDIIATEQLTDVKTEPLAEAPKEAELVAEELAKPAPTVASKAADTVLYLAKQEAFSDSRLKTSESKKKADLSSVSGYASAPAKKQVVGGKVTSESGVPIPGVNVVVKGTSTGTITDEQGNYTLELSDLDHSQLVFSFIGSLTNEVPVNNQLIVNTQLKDDVSQLSEVVVVGYGVEKNTDDDFPTVVMADPVGGKRNFKKYMETNLRYPQQALENEIEGRVTIQFTVRTDGSLDEFKVIKGIGHGCDEELVRLVKQGPKWYPSRQGETAVESMMRVRMRFKLP